MTAGSSGWRTRQTAPPSSPLATTARSRCGTAGPANCWLPFVPGRRNVWAAVEFLPDAHTVIVATRDGAVYTWDTRVEYWIEFACRVAGRNLTDAEWHDVFGDRRYRKTCP